MNALAPFASRAIATALCAALSIPATAQSTATRPPNGGRGAGTVPVWNPFVVRPDNPPLTLRVLVLNYDPVVTAAADAADGPRVTARIDVAARSGAFAADDVGEFEIELLGFAVGDAEGRFAAPARLGSLRIATR